MIKMTNIILIFYTGPVIMKRVFTNPILFFLLLTTILLGFFLYYLNNTKMSLYTITLSELLDKLKNVSDDYSKMAEIAKNYKNENFIILLKTYSAFCWGFVLFVFSSVFKITSWKKILSIPILSNKWFTYFIVMINLVLINKISHYLYITGAPKDYVWHKFAINGGVEFWASVENFITIVAMIIFYIVLMVCVFHKKIKHWFVYILLFLACFFVLKSIDLSLNYELNYLYIFLPFLCILQIYILYSLTRHFYLKQKS